MWDDSAGSGGAAGGGGPMACDREGQFRGRRCRSGGNCRIPQ